MVGITDSLMLEIERMPEKELLDLHLDYIKQCMEYDLWKDISETMAWKMREALGFELRTRMSAE